MKKISSYFGLLLLVIGFVCSCTSSPEYGKMIPNDALFVMSMNVQEAAERSELGDATLLKEQIDKSLAHAKMPPATREQLKEIMENPQKTGFDFREPILFFSAASFPNKYGLVGSVSDQDDLEDFFQMLYKEGVCTSVLETDGLRYTQFKDMVLAFNEEFFFATGMVEGQTSVSEVLGGFQKLMALPAERSMQNNEVFGDMLERDGFMHMLYLGSGIDMLAKELHLSEEEMQKMMPKEVQIEEIGCVIDVDLKKGEVSLVSEILPLSDQAEEWLDQKASEVYGNLEGTLTDYISQDALCFGYGNIQGAALFQQLKLYPDFLEAIEAEPEKGKVFENILSDFQGDIAFSVETAQTAAGVPEFSLFADTKEQSWLHWVENGELNDVQKIDDRTYAWEMPDPQYLAYDQTARGTTDIPTVGTAVFGAKKGISYLLFGKSAKTFELVERPVQVNSEYTGYFRLNAEQLLNLEFVKQQLGPIAFLPYKKVVGLFDYAEWYMEDGRKSTFRIVMRNKEQSPVKTVYDEVEKILQIFG